jgi:hypothetical protein
MTAPARELPFDQHPLSGRVDPSTVVAALGRRHIRSTLALEEAFSLLDMRLSAAGVDADRIRALEDIVAELALNIHIHGSPEHDWILICLGSENDLSVVMLGEGSVEDVKHMRYVLESIQRRVSPHDSQKLFELRNERAWSTRHVPNHRKGGAGLGLLTISALAREYPKLESLRSNGDAAFYVISKV